ncbi:MAG: DUF2087 domain-containing protein [Micromonosporaceae bacterium]
MQPDVLVGLLAEPDRTRVFAAVVLGAATPAEVAERTDLPARTVAAALRRLTEGGLVAPGETGLVACLDAIKDARRSAEPVKADEPLDPDRTRATVLRAFVVDGRLVSIPAARSKRRVVLEHLAASFEPGVRYPEREVDAILRAWYADHASLRRYLVDEELLTREDGVYWRIGGPTL